MTTPLGGQHLHSDLVAENSTAKPSSNPFAQSANITVSVPEAIEIRLVDASTLADYELWVFLTSILSSAAVGFVIGAIQTVGQPSHTSLVICAWLFGALTVLSGWAALSKRRQLNKKSKSAKFCIGDPIQDQSK